MTPSESLAWGQLHSVVSVVDGAVCVTVEDERGEAARLLSMLGLAVVGTDGVVRVRIGRMEIRAARMAPMEG